MGLFVNASDGTPLVGKVWPGLTVFPDFFNPKAEGYWEVIITLLHSSPSIHDKCCVVISICINYACKDL
jgi:hypothetical protein